MSSFSFGELHPALVHFPIALIFAVFAFDLVYFFKRQEIYQRIASWVLITATILLIPTAITGLLAKEAFFPAGDPDVLRHQISAIVMALFIIGYAIYRGHALYERKILALTPLIILGLASISLISTTAEFGSVITRGKGLYFSSLKIGVTPNTTEY